MNQSMNQQEPSPPKVKAPEPAIKPYKTPRLRLLGSLRGLTKTMGAGGTPDVFITVNDSP